jgi:uncharacterized protein involved in exopolysaccharide biosynthesis
MSVKRYLGTFYRGRRLYIPVLLLLLAATALGTYYLASTQYEATARVWVDKPALDNVLDPNAPSGYAVSPGQQQADKITQLLQTDSFVAAIISNTSASGRLVGDPERDRVIKEVRGKLTVTPFGSNTIRIAYASGDPVLSQQIVQGAIDQFRSWDLTARVEQSAIERQFYQKQLQIYQDQVDAASKRVDDFQLDHPFPDPASPQYLELQSLQRELDSARALLSATSARIEQANAANSLADTSRQYEFQVLDAPTVPTRPTATLTRLAEYLALGIFASFALIFCAVAFATWQDTTIRNGDDLQRLTGVPLLDAIPHLPPNGRPTTDDRRPTTNTAGATRAPRKPAGQLDEPAAVYPSSITE